MVNSQKIAPLTGWDKYIAKCNFEIAERKKRIEAEQARKAETGNTTDFSNQTTYQKDYVAVWDEEGSDTDEEYYECQDFNSGQKLENSSYNRPNFSNERNYQNKYSAGSNYHSYNHQNLSVSSHTSESYRPNEINRDCQSFSRSQSGKGNYGNGPTQHYGSRVYYNSNSDMKNAVSEVRQQSFSKPVVNKLSKKQKQAMRMAQPLHINDPNDWKDYLDNPKLNACEAQTVTDSNDDGGSSVGDVDAAKKEFVDAVKDEESVDCEEVSFPEKKNDGVVPNTGVSIAGDVDAVKNEVVDSEEVFLPEKIVVSHDIISELMSSTNSTAVLECKDNFEENRMDLEVDRLSLEEFAEKLVDVQCELPVLQVSDVVEDDNSIVEVMTTILSMVLESEDTSQMSVATGCSTSLEESLYETDFGTEV